MTAHWKNTLNQREQLNCWTKRELANYSQFSLKPMIIFLKEKTSLLVIKLVQARQWLSPSQSLKKWGKMESSKSKRELSSSSLHLQENWLIKSEMKWTVSNILKMISGLLLFLEDLTFLSTSDNLLNNLISWLVPQEESLTFSKEDALILVILVLFALTKQITCSISGLKNMLIK